MMPCCWAYLEELIQEEGEPVSQHLLRHRLGSDTQGKNTTL